MEERRPLSGSAYPPVDRDTLVDRAVAFAADAHAGQRRKDGRTPYIVHPVAVMRRLATRLGVDDPELLAAAVLHDVLEDTSRSAVEIEGRFGPVVRARVEELTVPAELHGPSVPDEKKTGRLLEDVGRVDWGAVAIKLCDRADNLEDVAHVPWTAEKRSRYAAHSRWILDAVVARLRRDPPPPTLREAIRRGRTDLEEAIQRAEEKSAPETGRS